jgi:hypothetical protein
MKNSPHTTRSLKNGQKLLNLHEGETFDALVHCVQAFIALLSLLPMKEIYACKVTFLHDSSNLGRTS